jgi:hypothetical protein
MVWARDAGLDDLVPVDPAVRPGSDRYEYTLTHATHRAHPFQPDQSTIAIEIGIVG